MKGNYIKNIINLIFNYIKNIENKLFNFHLV